MQLGLAELESRLWDAADELRANSGLKASEYGSPVLGLIFLRFADARFEAAREAIEAKGSARRKIGPSDYHAERLIYLAPAARFSSLLELPEGSDLGKAVNEAMRLVEEHNPDLAGVLPRTYTAIDNSTIASLPHVKPANPDGLVNWLTTHLINALQHSAVMRTRARIDQVADAEVCRLDVARSSVPVHARMSDGREAFWVRMNNSTRELPELEIEKYVSEHWGS